MRGIAMGFTFRAHTMFPLSRCLLPRPRVPGPTKSLTRNRGNRHRVHVGDVTAPRTLVLEQFDIARFDSDVRILEKCANPLHFYSQAKFILWLAQPVGSRVL